MKDVIDGLEAGESTRKRTLHRQVTATDVRTDIVIVYAAADDGTLHPLVSLGGQRVIRDEDHALASAAATVATEAVIRPGAPKIFYVNAIWVVGGTFGANRNFSPKITDGTVEFAMNTNATSVPSGGNRQIWPEKGADDDYYTSPNFPVTNAYWIVIEDNMVSAETATVWVTYVQRSAES